VLKPAKGVTIAARNERDEEDFFSPLALLFNK
jgi:hypothetical protein